MFLFLLCGFGILGVFCRYFIDQTFITSPDGLPVGTLFINFIACLLAGVIYVASTERGMLSTEVSAALLVGFCGGFSTFSAYSLQSLLLLENGKLSLGLIYLCGSPLLGIAATFIGIRGARGFFG